MSDVIKDIVIKLGQLSDTEREDALSAITNHFCLGCGAAGDWSEKTCDCLPRALREPEALAASTPPPSPKWPSFAFQDAGVDWSSAKRLY